MPNLNQLIISLQLRFFKRKVIRDVLNSRKKKRVLLYYKTDPFFSKRLVNLYSHTNNAEILIIADILRKHGYAIDVIDRTADWTEIASLKGQNYKIFLGIGSGNFKYFNKIKSKFNFEKVVIIGTGPEPLQNNKLVFQAHQDCIVRNKKNFNIRRLICSSNSDILERYSNVDAVFYYGNDYNKEYWSSVSENRYRIFPSTSPNIEFSLEELTFKESNRFLYFSANGLICKGLDIVIEAFSGLDGVVLDICAPFSEEDFWEYYKPIVDENQSINLHGFVSVGSDLFNDITKRASFNIFPGVSEGCATSVITTMRRGVIPIVTKESGLDESISQFLIEDRSVKGVRDLVIGLSDTNEKILKQKIIQTYLDSFIYTNESFYKSFESALIRTEVLCSNSNES